MKVFVLASGITRNEYWWRIKFTDPKPLLPLGENRFGGPENILSIQMRRYRKYGLQPVFIIGYQGEKIIEWCNEFEVGPIQYIWDRGYDSAYSIPRTLIEVDEELRQESEFLLIHGDLIFDDNLIEYLLGADGDIARANRQNMAFKFTHRGYEEMMKIIFEQRDTNGLNDQLWRQLEGKVKFAESPLIWMFDVDNPVEYVQAKQMAKSRIN